MRYQVDFPRKDLERIAERSFIASLVCAEYAEVMYYTRESNKIILKEFHDVEKFQSEIGVSKYKITYTPPDQSGTIKMYGDGAGVIHSHPKSQTTLSDTDTANKDLVLLLRALCWSELAYYASGGEKVPTGLGNMIFSTAIAYADKNIGKLPKMYQLLLREYVKDKDAVKEMGKRIFHFEGMEKTEFSESQISHGNMENTKDSFIENVLKIPEAFLEAFFPDDKEAEFDFTITG